MWKSSPNHAPSIELERRLPHSATDKQGIEKPQRSALQGKLPEGRRKRPPESENNRGEGGAMKIPGTLQTHQFETFARFLEEHPGFSPLLMGPDALVCGFQVGGAYLAITEMEQMMTTQPHFDAHDAALLLTPAGRPERGHTKRKF
jgi:hypothetical protein